MPPLRTVDLDLANHAIVLIDQTRLPNEEVLLHLHTQQEIWHAINCLQVRGAPAIGVTAAFALYLAALEITDSDAAQFLSKLAAAQAYLASSRPTAVNLSWALQRMYDTACRVAEAQSVDLIRQCLQQEALAIRDEDIARCHAIGRHGVTLLRDGMGILTHCNAGRLAAVEYGTALAPLYEAQKLGYNLHIYADETRPLLQGARLTAYELHSAGLDTTLICDNMAATVMAQGLVDAVLVGADRISAAGDVANKIGTLGVAILAQHYGIPFYVAAPTSTLDLACADGAQIEIEQRSGTEISTLWYSKPLAPAAVKTLNPAFDVTPHALVTALITEKGILRPPFAQAIARTVNSAHNVAHKEE